jgi:hypothetical protein
MSLHHRPTIDELLADSLIQKVMRADGVEPQALKALLNGAAGRIAEARASRAGVVFVGAPAERRNPLRRPGAPAPARRAARSYGGECGSALCC